MSARSILVRLDTELTPRGFLRRNTTWNRQRGAVVDVIDIQTNKSRELVTLNVGVFSRQVHIASWGRDADEFVEEPDCTVRARVGALVGDHDRWWDISSPGTTEEIAKCLGPYVLPFIERMQSLEEMRDWLAPSVNVSTLGPWPPIYFAVIQSQLGDKDGARKTLAALENKARGSLAIVERLREVTARIT